MHLETSYKKNAANIFELFAVKILSLGLNKFLTSQFYLIISTTTKKNTYISNIFLIFTKTNGH